MLGNERAKACERSALPLKLARGCSFCARVLASMDVSAVICRRARRAPGAPFKPLDESAPFGLPNACPLQALWAPPAVTIPRSHTPVTEAG